MYSDSLSFRLQQKDLMNLRTKWISYSQSLCFTIQLVKQYLSIDIVLYI